MEKEGIKEIGAGGLETIGAPMWALFQKRLADLEQRFEGIKDFVPVVATALPTASEETMYKIYLVPSANADEGNVKDEYITIATTSGETTTYSWEQIGSTAIDMSGIESRISSLESAVADYALIPHTGEYAYGIEFDVTVSSRDCTRIGNSTLHQSLPVQSRMKGCLLDDNGNVVDYLDPTSWTGAVRDGSRGQVMVEIPEHYRKFETDGNKRRVLISEYPLPGYAKVKKQYVSAYQAALDRTNSKLASVVNTTTQYRGGNNTSGWDSEAKSLLGMPATSISRTNFRTYARNRKANSTEWNCMTYDMQKTLYWLYAIEYATLDSQKAYNAQLDANGYRQGGLGDGVTTVDGTKWSNFNSYNPFVPCGHTDSLGNGTGVVAFTMPTAYDSENTVTVNVPRYRGVENPFGHVWQWADGINVRINPKESNGGNNLSEVFVCSDPSKFTDSGYDGYSLVGHEARTDGFVKKVIFGEGGEIMPSEVGGGSTNYFCDYHFTSIPTTTTLRGVRFGGYAYYGAGAGFACANSYNAPWNTDALIGSRLCFIPEET